MWDLVLVRVVGNQIVIPLNNQDNTKVIGAIAIINKVTKLRFTKNDEVYFGMFKDVMSNILEKFK